jgi:PLP dependent protein
LNETNQDGGELGNRLHYLRECISRAAIRSGRTSEEITLIAVSKHQSAKSVLALAQLGIEDFGENYVQEAIGKSESLRDLRWHLIGGLQKNKTGKAVGLFETIHTVDGEALGKVIDRKAGEIGKIQRVLVEVNLSGEAHRSGIAPEATLALCECLDRQPHLALEGLMGVAPVATKREEAQRAFGKLRSLYEQLPKQNRRTLSMGMSGDFEIAIENGATQIRIGTALFGARTD